MFAKNNNNRHLFYVPENVKDTNVKYKLAVTGFRYRTKRSRNADRLNIILRKRTIRIIANNYINSVFFFDTSVSARYAVFSFLKKPLFLISADAQKNSCDFFVFLPADSTINLLIFYNLFFNFKNDSLYSKDKLIKYIKKPINFPVYVTPKIEFTQLKDNMFAKSQKLSGYFDSNSLRAQLLTKFFKKRCMQ